MIKRIRVTNFRSLDGFEVSGLGRFVCLIGLNGSGKSTLLLFLDLVRALLQGRVTEWFAAHRWRPTDIVTFGSARKLIEFEIDLCERPDDDVFTWRARFNPQEKRCTFEELVRVTPEGRSETLCRFADGKLWVGAAVREQSRLFRFEGSVLARLAETPEPLKWLSATHVFGVLNPEAIAQSVQLPAASARTADVGPDGRGLVAFVSSLSEADCRDLLGRLRRFSPQISGFEVRKRPFGWRNLMFREMDRALFDASHLSYGTLRLMIYLSQAYSGARTLLFDEIENGINQELVGPLLRELCDFRGKQVIVTTHSALLLNWMTDDKAREAVILLAKNAGEPTRAVPFFSVPSVASRLGLLGPGEVMADTDLTALSAEAAKEKP